MTRFFLFLIVLLSSHSLLAQKKPGVKPEVKKTSGNLVVNGDFSGDVPGFETSYRSIDVAKKAQAGVYMITANPVDMNGAYCSMPDHTSGKGKMMVVDVSMNGSADIIWKQTVSVKPKTGYTFSLYAASLYNSTPITLVVEINKVKVITKVLPVGSNTCGWQRYFVDWSSVAATQATIAVYSTSTDWLNADLALDDIRFSVKGSAPVDNTPMGVEYIEEHAPVAEQFAVAVIDEPVVDQVMIAEAPAPVYNSLDYVQTKPAEPVVPAIAPATTTRINGKNLIVNGDFGRGAQGFVSAYKTNCTAAPGVYAIVEKSVDMNGWYLLVHDHTPGTNGKGKIMVVDGSESGADVIIWGQTVKVKPGKKYTLVINVASLYQSNPPRLIVRINNLSAALTPLPEVPGQWKQYQTVWEAEDATTAAISISSASTAYMGNDFALDDIQFYKVRKK